MMFKVYFGDRLSKSRAAHEYLRVVRKLNCMTMLGMLAPLKSKNVLAVKLRDGKYLVHESSSSVSSLSADQTP